MCWKFKAWTPVFLLVAAADHEPVTPLGRRRTVLTSALYITDHPHPGWRLEDGAGRQIYAFRLTTSPEEHPVPGGAADAYPKRAQPFHRDPPLAIEMLEEHASANA